MRARSVLPPILPVCHPTFSFPHAPSPFLLLFHPHEKHLRVARCFLPSFLYFLPSLILSLSLICKTSLTQIATTAVRGQAEVAKGFLLKGNHLPNAICDLQIIAEVVEVNNQSPGRGSKHPYFILFFLLVLFVVCLGSVMPAISSEIFSWLDIASTSSRAADGAADREISCSWCLRSCFAQPAKECISLNFFDE